MIIQQMGKVQPLWWPFPRHNSAVIVAQCFPMPYLFIMLRGLPNCTAWACIAAMSGRAVASPLCTATLAAPSIARSQRGRMGPPPFTLSLGSTISRSANHAIKNISATASHYHVLGPGGMPLGRTALPRQACTGKASTGTHATVSMPVPLMHRESQPTTPR